MFIEILTALVGLLFSIVVYFQIAFNYWEKRNIPYIKPVIPWGTVGNMLKAKKNISVVIKDSYKEFKSKGHPFGGMYLMTQPLLLVVNPELVKKVLSKDFQYFTGHGIHVDEEKDPFSGNLFSLDGEKWRNMRVKLTPTFTSGKMKLMFPILINCGGPMIDYIDGLSKEGNILNIKEILACFTTDVIGTAAFGIECNSFKGSEAEFRKHGRQIFESTWRSSLYRILNIIIPRLRLTTLTKETRDFFFNSFSEIVNQREKHNLKRNDFVQLLLEINEKAKSSGSADMLTVGQMTAQSVMFFAAGFETSSTTMTFCLHELAHHLDIQEKLRREINSTMKKYDGKLTYEGIMEMKYMNMVIEETLRKFPPAALIIRECTKPYTVEETGTVVEQGMKVFISVLGLHRDPQYFPNPEKFDPERFSDENKHQIPPYTYIPFGEGPRICIGLRFGVMQAKVGLCLLLKNYILTPHDSMNYNMGFNPNSQVLGLEKDLLLRAQKIN